MEAGRFADRHRTPVWSDSSLREAAFHVAMGSRRFCLILRRSVRSRAQSLISCSLWQDAPGLVYLEILQRTDFRLAFNWLRGPGETAFFVPWLHNTNWLAHGPTGFHPYSYSASCIFQISADEWSWSPAPAGPKESGRRSAEVLRIRDAPFSLRPVRTTIERCTGTNQRGKVQRRLPASCGNDTYRPALWKRISPNLIVPSASWTGWKSNLESLRLSSIMRLIL